MKLLSSSVAPFPRTHSDRHARDSSAAGEEGQTPRVVEESFFFSLFTSFPPFFSHTTHGSTGRVVFWGRLFLPPHHLLSRALPLPRSDPRG